MKERPIIFSGPMVRALLDGRKTQTRRIVKPQPRYDIVQCEGGIGFYEKTPNPTSSGYSVFGCPYGVPGDRLWVRETWRPSQVDGVAWYAETCGDESHHRWRPSIHMPRWASRITLEITGVRVERVQSISREDAIAEGCDEESLGSQHCIDGMPAPCVWYMDLWNSLNAARGFGWDANPWCWVLEFRRVQP